MAFTESWIESDPDGAVITGSLLDDYQRQSKRAIRERLEGDPANPNSGIYESASFGATAIVRAGTARAYAVTAAGVAGLTLQDGRMAITTDTKRLFHLKATGAVEIGYLPLNAAGDVDSLGYHLSGVGTYATAKMYRDGVNGLILSGIAGSSYDLVLTNSAGTPTIRVLTGTTDVTCPGTFTSVNLVATTTVTSPVFSATGTVSASGVIRMATGTGLSWRNSGNTGDIAVLYTSGAVTHIDGESGISLDKATTMALVSGVSATSPGIAWNVFDSGKVSTTIGANVLQRLASNASGADTTLQFTDSVSYNAYISAKANTFYFTVAATIPVSIDVNGINASNLILVDDQSKKLTLARYSVGLPSAYIKIPAAASSGFRMTNAAGTTDVLILDNSGNMTLAGGMVLGSWLDISGSALAVAAGHLSIGGNTSTTANTYGGGGVSALPAQPAGYLPIFLGATQYKVPYYTA